MDFQLTDEQERFRAEVCSFCAHADLDFDDPSRSKGLKGGYSREFYRELGRRGWLGLQLPLEYGGAGRAPIYETLFAEELGQHELPAGNYAGSVLEFGNLVLRHGSEWQRRTYLPRITSGEIRAGHAYTEPEAGSDLSAVRTRAVRHGGEYVVNGLKMFASEIERADYTVLMARTDPDAPPERGISLFILDNRSEGVSDTRLETMGGKGTYLAYLDNVRIPERDRIGEENAGWEAFLDIRAEYWTKNQGYFLGTLQRLLTRLVDHVRTADGGRLQAEPLVRDRLARLAIRVRGLRWLSYRLATAARPHEEGRLIAALKVYTDTLILDFADEAMRIIGQDSLLERDGESGPFGLVFENRYRENALKHFSSLGHSFARTVLAVDVLGLPPTA